MAKMQTLRYAPSSFQERVYNKVKAIKAVRCLTGIGLKEAKDVVERAYDGHPVSVPSAKLNMEADRREALRNIEAEGFQFGPATTKIAVILESLHLAVKMAIDENDKELASIMLKALMKYERAVERRDEKAAARAERKEERYREIQQREKMHEGSYR